MVGHNWCAMLFALGAISLWACSEAGDSRNDGGEHALDGGTGENSDAGAGGAADAGTADSKPLRLAYVWGGDEPVREVIWSAWTHLIHNYVSPVRDGDTVSLDTSVITSELADAMTTAAHTNGVKVLLCVGGGGTDSNPFVNATDTTAHTESLADVIVQEVVEHGYDGVDIDWETNIPAAQYAALLSSLRLRLDQHTSSVDGKKLQLTTFLGDPAVAIPSIANLDLVALSCYDNHGWLPSGLMGPVVWHDAALYQPGDGNRDGDGPFDCATSMASGVAAGIPKSKLSAAVPFYVRRWIGGMDAAGEGAHALSQRLISGASIEIKPQRDMASFSPTRDVAAGNVLWYGIDEAGNANDQFFSWWDPLTLKTGWSFVRDNKYGAMSAFALEYERVYTGTTPEERNPMSAALLEVAGPAR